MVEFTKKRLREFSIPRFILLIILIGAIVYALSFTNLIRKNCKQDITCFNEAAKTCKAVKYIHIQNNNIYDYAIDGADRDKCILKIKLRRMAIGTSEELRTKLEGKGMVCKIPREELKIKSTEEIENFIVYCSGPLKESIYELIIERMYGLIIKNFGDIITEVKEKVL